jgi:glycine/D-amino acid oxidase-like deaminating enzyme
VNRPSRTPPSATADVVIVGAGIVGAACAYYASRAGLRVTVVDRGPLAGGTTSAGEGNILASDKVPGPELDLIVRSRQLWREIGADVGHGRIELEPKGALVVASSPAGLTDLEALATAQRAAGVDSVGVSPGELPAYEPQLARGLAGGVFYPGDLQVQPMKAAARLLADARLHGAAVLLGVEVVAIGVTDRAVSHVRLADGRRIEAAAVVNAAGTWSGAVAALAGVDLPIAPRRGFILVTEPIGPQIRHKVYAAEYVSNVGSDREGLETSAVIEGTPAGTVLIGASRERVGFDLRLSLPVLRQLARQAVALFPFLATVCAIRAYRGFRPYSPDHTPVIGADPRVAGLYHACGHEGAGIGLAPVTAELVVAALTGRPPTVAAQSFSPGRFA